MKNKTCHKIIIGASQLMSQVEDRSVELVVTSPPYPMILMWDEIMASQNSKIKESINRKNGQLTFELMHQELDKIWSEVNRVLVDGGIACINIGDATRTIDNRFSLYSNHSRIISAFNNLGMSNLPNILWRKQTNAPNKFMGSGMLPASAYVTLEHEWILIFRKGGKRIFKSPAEKLNRSQSAFFWEERNIWFSDLWELKGAGQKIKNPVSRDRSAAYPFDIPYRLINMYSLQGDTVLDPFLGTGTTTLASIALKRNSIGYEIDEHFLNIIKKNIKSVPRDFYHALIKNRIKSHMEFIKKRQNDSNKNEIKYFNENIQLPVMTKQESQIVFKYVDQISEKESSFNVTYCDVVPDNHFNLPKTNNNEFQNTLF